MNKRERVLAAFQNQQADYVPGCFWRHFSLEMNRGEDIVEAHLKFYRDTDNDLLKISCDGFFGWPAKQLQGLTDVSQLYELEHIAPDHEFIRGQVERAKAIVDRVKGECVTLYTLFCPMAIFRLQVGWDMMMECFDKDPKAVLHACDVIAEDENRLIHALITEAGVDGIFYSVQNAEITRFSLAQYKEWVEPSDTKVLAFAQSLTPYNVLHCCGWDADEAGTVNHLDSWTDYKAGMVSWASYVDHQGVSQIRELFHGLPAWGGFDNRRQGVLYSGTEAQVREETRRMIDQGGHQGYILGPDCSMPDDIASERIRWVLDEAKQHPLG